MFTHRSTKSKTAPARRRLSLESLENRELLSVSALKPIEAPVVEIESVESRSFALEADSPAVQLDGNTLRIVGTDQADWVEVSQTGSTLYVYSFSAYGTDQTLLGTFGTSSVSTLDFQGGDGDDVFKNLTAVTSILDGGDGNNLLMGGSGTNTFYNTGLGSNCFVWRGSNDRWADGSSNDSAGKDDAQLCFYAYDVDGNRVGGHQDPLREWTEQEVLSVVSAVQTVYRVMENYAFFRFAGYDENDPKYRNQAVYLTVSNDAPANFAGYCMENGSIGFLGSQRFSESEWTNTVVHEFAHNWQKTNPYFQSFSKISWDGALPPHVPGDFAGDYGMNGNNEDWATAVESILLCHQDPGSASQRWYEKADIVRQFLNSIGSVKLWGQISTVVTTDQDVFDLHDGEISLREAIIYSGNRASITFASNLAGKTIKLNGTPLSGGRNITIDGSGMNITIDADGKGAIFDNENYVMGGFGDSFFTLIGLTLTGATGDKAIDTFCQTLFLVDSHVVENQSSLLFDGRVRMLNSVIAGNDTYRLFGIYRTTTIINSLIIGNSGQLSNLGSETAPMTITNSTIVGNSGSFHLGSETWVVSGNLLTINNSIIADNGSGSAFSVWGGKIIVNNSLIDRIDNLAPFTIGTSSIYSTTSTPINSLFVNYTPGGNWRDWDLHFRSNSPALGKGNTIYLPGGITSDFEGAPRHNKGAIDMGAYQHPYVIGNLPDASQFATTAAASDFERNSATLSWLAPNVTDYPIEKIEYHVSYRKSGFVDWVNLASQTALSWKFSGLDYGTTYEYKIEATINGIEGFALATGDFRTPVAGVPHVNQPTGVKCTQVFVPENSLKITWKAPTNYSGGYVVSFVELLDDTNEGVPESIEIKVAKGARLEAVVPLSQLEILRRSGYRISVRADIENSVESVPTYNGNFLWSLLPTLPENVELTERPSSIAPPTKSLTRTQITASNFTVFWNDSQTVAPLWYQVTVMDASRKQVEIAYVASGTQQFTTSAPLASKGAYNIEVMAFYGPGTNQEMRSGPLWIAVTSGTFAAATVKVDAKQVDITSAKGLTVTPPKNATTDMFHYIEYTSTVDAKGKPLWEDATLEKVTGTTHDLAAFLKPGTQYFVRIITVDKDITLDDNPAWDTVTRAVIGKVVKFKTRAVPLAKITTTAFAMTADGTFGIRLRMTTPAQNDKATATVLPAGTTFSYELIVAGSNSKTDKSTGLLTDGINLGAVPFTETTVKGKLFSDSLVIPFSSVAQIGDLTTMKNIQIQLLTTYTLPDGTTITNVATKVTKLTLPKWFA